MGWTMLDGVLVPIPSPEEQAAFDQYIKVNKVLDPFHPEEHYDHVSAFRDGISRGQGPDGHFPDTYKLPGHPTFSVESVYYKPGMDAGYWVGDKYIRFGKGQPYENTYLDNGRK